MSKKSGFFDISVEYVDGIDISQKRVEEIAFYRHEETL